MHNLTDALSGHARRADSAARALIELWRDLRAAYRHIRTRWADDHGRATIADDDLDDPLWPSHGRDPAGPSAVSTNVTPADLRWHYGPTGTDPDPCKMWHYGCGSEVWIIDDGYICSGCGATE